MTVLSALWHAVQGGGDGLSQACNPHRHIR